MATAAYSTLLAVCQLAGVGRDFVQMGSGAEYDLVSYMPEALRVPLIDICRSQTYAPGTRMTSPPWRNTHE
jgi:hypothetical protein